MAGQDVVQPDTVALRPDLRQEETAKTLVPSLPCRRNNSIVPVAGAAQRSPHANTALSTRTLRTRIVRMLRDGQRVRVNLAGMRVGSVVFHAPRLPTQWVLLSARFRSTHPRTK